MTDVNHVLQFLILLWLENYKKIWNKKFEIFYKTLNYKEHEFYLLNEIKWKILKNLIHVN